MYFKAISLQFLCQNCSSMFCNIFCCIAYVKIQIFVSNISCKIFGLSLHIKFWPTCYYGIVFTIMFWLVNFLIIMAHVLTCQFSNNYGSLLSIKKQHFVCAFVIIWFHFKNENLEPYAFLVFLYIHYLAITSAAYVYLRTPYAYLLQPGNSYKVHIYAYVHKCIYSKTKQESHKPMLEHHSSLLNCSLLQEIKGAKKPTCIWRHKYTMTVALLDCMQRYGDNTKGPTSPSLKLLQGNSNHYIMV